MCDCMNRGNGSGIGNSGGGIDFHIKRSHQGTGAKQTLAALLSPTIWGPCVWRILHDLAEVSGGCGGGDGTGTGADGELWEELGRVLPGALPCTECTRHLAAWIAAHPPRGDPRLWVLAAHNAVNVRLGRRPWTEAELTASYQSCDRIMLGIELDAFLASGDGQIGVLGDTVVRVMQRLARGVR
jgi:hypothetical protein